MTEWISDDSVDDAMAQLEAEQQRLRDFEAAIAETTTTVRAKDRSLSMTFTGRGDLTSMAFHGNKYRSMAPAELAHVIVETLATGRAECMTKMGELMGGSIIPGVDFAELASGKVSTTDLMESLLSPFLNTAADDGVLGRSVPREGGSRHD